MSESFGWRTRRGFGYLASLRLLGLVLQVLLLRLVGSALSGPQLSGFLLGIALLAWSGMLGTAGFLPPLLRRMAQEGEPRALADSIRPARRRSILAGVFFLILALSLGATLLPTLALAGLHLLLPLHLAAAPELLEGRTRLLARAELLARILTLSAFGILAWVGTSQTWPWLICWWIGSLTPSLLLWLQLIPRQRALFGLGVPRSLTGSLHSRVSQKPEHLVAVGDFLRSGWFAGIHPFLTAMVGSLGYLGFGAAFSLHRVGATLPSALATAVQGPLSQGSEAQQRRSLLRILPAWMVFGGIAAIVGRWLAPMLLTFLFPNLSASSHEEAILAIQLLMASWPALFGAGLCIPFLLARGREAQVALLSGLALLACFTLLWLLLPSLGPTAAAWSLLFTEGIVFAGSLLLVLMPRRNHMQPAPQSLS